MLVGLRLMVLKCLHTNHRFKRIPDSYLIIDAISIDSAYEQQTPRCYRIRSSYPP